jgi:hypothetical protein
MRTTFDLLVEQAAAASASRRSPWAPRRFAGGSPVPGMTVAEQIDQRCVVIGNRRAVPTTELQVGSYADI